MERAVWGHVNMMFLFMSNGKGLTEALTYTLNVKNDCL